MLQSSPLSVGLHNRIGALGSHLLMPFRVLPAARCVRFSKDSLVPHDVVAWRASFFSIAEVAACMQCAHICLCVLIHTVTLVFSECGG